VTHSQTAGIKRLDPTRYAPDETIQQVALRVARDQVDVGVADGERDIRWLITNPSVDLSVISEAQYWDLVFGGANDE
jgi:hypothetical protein